MFADGAIPDLCVEYVRGLAATDGTSGGTCSGTSVEPEDIGEMTDR